MASRVGVWGGWQGEGSRVAGRVGNWGGWPGGSESWLAWWAGGVGWQGGVRAGRVGRGLETWRKVVVVFRKVAMTWINVVK